MSHETWTPLIGAKDIFRHLKARAHWGALIWAIALAILMNLDGRGPHAPTKGPLIVALAGGLGAGLAMGRKLTQRHQWTGLIPYLLVTMGILLVILPMTFLGHWIWGFASAKEFRWVLGLGALGAMLRGVGASDWMTPYRRRG